MINLLTSQLKLSLSPFHQSILVTSSPPIHFSFLLREGKAFYGYQPVLPYQVAVGLGTSAWTIQPRYRKLQALLSLLGVHMKFKLHICYICVWGVVYFMHGALASVRPYKIISSFCRFSCGLLDPCGSSSILSCPLTKVFRATPRTWYVMHSVQV